MTNKEEDKEMKEIECNQMALLMKKGARDTMLPESELNILKFLVNKYPEEHKKILKGECPY
jgi:hypothetical protein